MSSSESIEISDVEEASQHEELDSVTFQRRASKGWKTCSSGFDHQKIVDEQLKNSIKELTNPVSEVDGKCQFLKKQHKRFKISDGFEEINVSENKIESQPQEAEFSNQSDIDRKVVLLKKGSEWLKSIQWDMQPPVTQASGRCPKKKISPSLSKVLEGGFAEQAIKLQNKERSDKIIWNHQKEENMRKCGNSCLCVLVKSCSVVSGTCLAKCTVIKEQGLSGASTSIGISEKDRMFAQWACEEPETVTLLLKPDSNCSNGSIIRIFPPWKTLEVSGFNQPVILCVNYFDVKPSKENNPETITSEKIVFLNRNSESDSCFTQYCTQFQNTNDQASQYREHLSGFSELDKLNLDLSKDILSQPSSSQYRIHISPVTRAKTSNNSDHSKISDVPTADSEVGNLPNEMDITGNCYKTKICVFGRVQRIYHYVSEHRSGTESYADMSTNTRVSLILQDKNSRFCELQLIACNGCWLEITKVSAGEGRCFSFDNVEIKENMHSSKYPTLFAILRHIIECQTGDQVVKAIYPVCYQATVRCVDNVPKSMSEQRFPPFCHYKLHCIDEILSLQGYCRQFGVFIAKVFCEENGNFHISDNSLQRKRSNQYVTLRFCKSSLKPSLLNQALVILIADAAVNNKCFYIDKYSTVTVLSVLQNSQINFPLCISKNLPLNIMEDIVKVDVRKNYSWSFLSSVSRVGDLVSVQGRIVDVNVETSVCSLECNKCGNDNLYGDINSTIYCKLCDIIVNQPNLNMRMNVQIAVPQLQFMYVRVELTSKTTKKILKVPDHDTQPKCEVKDVLSQEIGPVFCCIKSRENKNSKLCFNLLEIHVL